MITPPGNGILENLSYAIESIRKTRRNQKCKSIYDELKWLAKIPLYFYLNISSKRFDFQGKQYRYFYHPYNRTDLNERCIEIPIVTNYLKQSKGLRILEVGNVLSHYFPVTHDIVDKYEIGKGVENQDIIEFKSENKFDLIVSISTLEHVGWDEEPRDENKSLRAIENLKTLCNKSGRIIVTFPLGHNPHLDKAVLLGGIPDSEWFFLKRDEINQWIKCNTTDAKKIKYGEPYPFANGIGVGVIKPICNRINSK